MPAKEAIYFTKQQIQRLIELYQGEENLWNISSTDYHKRDKKNDSLEKIKDILEDEFHGIQPFTVDQLWEKIANLRSYYCKELKKAAESKKSGAGTDEIYTSKWCHFKAFDSFLRSQVIPRKSTTNFTTSIRGDEGSGDDDDNGNNSDTSAASGDTSVTSLSQLSSQTPRRIVSGTKRRKLSRPEAVMEQACSVLSRISSTPRPSPQPVKEDEDDVFGKHVAMEMRQIKNERSKALARYKIQAILFEAQYNEPVPAPVTSGFQGGIQPRMMEQYDMYRPASAVTPSQLDDPMETYSRTFHSL